MGFWRLSCNAATLVADEGKESRWRLGSGRVFWEASAATCSMLTSAI